MAIPRRRHAKRNDIGHMTNDTPRKHGSYGNKEYIPGWTESNFQHISDAVYHTSVAIIRSQVFIDMSN